jgi:hypothetical protein
MMHETFMFVQQAAHLLGISFIFERRASFNINRPFNAPHCCIAALYTGGTRGDFTHFKGFSEIGFIDLDSRCVSVKGSLTDYVECLAASQRTLGISIHRKGDVVFFYFIGGKGIIR